MILDRIVAGTRERVKALKRRTPLGAIRGKAFELASDGKAFLFEDALKGEGVSLICEVKKASPSKGIIANDFPYVDIAAEYERAGAAAVSVLTEPEFFLGSDKYLTEISEAISLPVLRKDFIVDEYQIYEAKTIGASAVLLICALADTDRLKDYIRIADSIGLSALVEAHTEEEIKSALSAGARIIGINNRDLRTFKTDLNISLTLGRLIPRDKIFVSESGIGTPDDIYLLARNNVDAVLIGEAFMRAKNRERVISGFLNRR
ncbi:MAG: indole-3-glycerol phosphate synthase TrpC [Clostridiales bacterium]|jgi:indole-3-glycerol phosphate synthase|nr:indole-3-glycerol phosphate synthase TrpC [Clostridiales bacterium]